LYIFYSSIYTQDQSFNLDELQGAWWLESNTTTARFAIEDSLFWTDYDSEYHLAKIENGKTLVFDFKDGLIEKWTIISLSGDTLIAKHQYANKHSSLYRKD
jgi:hypothetical protein